MLTFKAEANIIFEDLVFRKGCFFKWFSFLNRLRYVIYDLQDISAGETSSVRSTVKANSSFVSIKILAKSSKVTCRLHCDCNNSATELKLF